MLILKHVTDFLFILLADQSKVEDFFIWVNSSHPTIKSTTYQDKISVYFLDTTIFSSFQNKRYTIDSDKKFLLTLFFISHTTITG